jgi:hypothetical protein
MIQITTYRRGKKSSKKTCTKSIFLLRSSCSWKNILVIIYEKYVFLGENQDCRMLQSGYADFLEFDDSGNPREISHLFWQNDVDEEVPYRADYSPNS